MASREKTAPCFTDGIYQERSIEKEVSGLTACFGYKQTSMAGCPVKGSIVRRCGRIMVRADGITRAEARAIESRREHASKAPSNLNQSAQGALISSRSGVNEDSTPDGSASRPRQYIDARLQGARRIPTVDGNLCH